jgi:ribokinase
MVKIAVLASFNMDLVMRTERRPDAGETLQGEFEMFLGGKGFNQAIAARRLGADVVVAGRVGDDEFGRLFLAALDREGIDHRAVVIDPVAGTGVASIIVEPDGTNTIVQSPRANRNVTTDEVARAGPTLAGAEVAMMQLETSHDGLFMFATVARGAGAMTLLNPAPAASLKNELMSLIDIVIANEIEAQTLTDAAVSDSESALRAAASLRARGPGVAVVTLGAAGAVAANGAMDVLQDAIAVHAIDTVGAGDAFCAALAVRMAEGADIAEAVRFANAAAALACTKHGAEPSMPTRDEVEELLRKGTTR